MGRLVGPGPGVRGVRPANSRRRGRVLPAGSLVDHTDPRTSQGEPSMTSPASPTTSTPEPAAAATRSPASPSEPTGSSTTSAANGTPTTTSTQGPAEVPNARRSPAVGATARKALTLTGAGIRRLRTLLGEIAWFACLLAATALLLGAVLVVLEANTRNALVAAVLRAAAGAPRGVSTRRAGEKHSPGGGAGVKTPTPNGGPGAAGGLAGARPPRRILTP